MSKMFAFIWCWRGFTHLKAHLATKSSYFIPLPRRQFVWKSIGSKNPLFLGSTTLDELSMDRQTFQLRLWDKSDSKLESEYDSLDFTESLVIVELFWLSFTSMTMVGESLMHLAKIVKPVKYSALFSHVMGRDYVPNQCVQAVLQTLMGLVLQPSLIWARSSAPLIKGECISLPWQGQLCVGYVQRLVLWSSWLTEVFSHFGLQVRQSWDTWECAHWESCQWSPSVVEPVLFLVLRLWTVLHSCPYLL